MTRLHRAAPLIAVCVFILPARPSARAVAANGPLQGGDLLVSNFYSPPGVFVYRHGSLAQTLTGSGSNVDVRGASYNSTGKVISTWDIYISGPSGLFVFDPVTGGVTSIPTPQVELPGDVSVMANGNYLVNDQWGNDLDVYSPAGVHLQTMNAPQFLLDSPMGSTIAPDGSIWVTIARTPDIVHLSPTGALLGSFKPGFNPGDIVVDRLDGTLWFPSIDSNTVHHFTADGQELGSFPTLLPQFSQTFMGIAMTPNRDLYVSNTGSGVIYRYDRQGNLQGSIGVPQSRGITFLSVVIPEPSSAALAAVGALVLLLRRQGRLANVESTVPRHFRDCS